jgi:hypothetical protein
MLAPPLGPRTPYTPRGHSALTEFRIDFSPGWVNIRFARLIDINHAIEQPAHHLSVGVQVGSRVLPPLLPETFLGVFER